MSSIFDVFSVITSMNTPYHSPCRLVKFIALKSRAPSKNGVIMGSGTEMSVRVWIYPFRCGSISIIMIIMIDVGGIGCKKQFQP